MKNRRGRRAGRHWLILPPLALGLPRHWSASSTGGTSRGTEDHGLQALFELTADPVLVLDQSHIILDANPAAARYLTRHAGALRGVSVLEVDLLARLLTAGSILQRVKTDPTPVSDEISIGDSEGRPLQCRIEAISIGGGRTLLHIQDTSVVLHTQSALRAVEQLHDALFQALPAVAWTMALPEERLLEISPLVERLFGYQPAAFRPQPELWDELVHPADRERVRAEFRKGLGAGRPFEIHFTGMHRDHRDLPHLVNRVVPVADERGFLDRCEGFIEDQRAQRHLEVELRATESNLRHTLDSISSGVLVVRPGPRGVEVVLCNRRLADLLRLDEPLQRGTLLSHAPEAAREIVCGGQSEFERRVTSDETRDEIAELRDPHRVLRRYAAPVRGADGGVVGRIITVEDVTSSWLMHRRLTHAQKMESMGRLAGGVAHDFNNLLGTVMGFGSLLLEQTPEGDPRREPLLEIVHAADRASRLTGALLTFSRSARFERLPVQLNRVIEDSYQLLRSTLEPSVALELKLDPALPPMLGDALLLQQIVVNLVQEVRDRLGAGGTLRISTRVEKQKGVPDEAGGDPQALASLDLEVSASVPHEPRQAPGLARSEPLPDRAGLALTMAEDIVRAHGGFLVSGPEASPATLRAMFPIDQLEETPLIVPEEAAARGHETILVVDDEPGLRMLAKTGLQKRGFQVITAENGQQALEVLRNGEPAVDLVVLDLSMPGLSGERVLRAIRGFKPELPVIIASGYATVESQTSWNAAGAQGFVTKPYRIQDVAGKVRDVLDRAHGRVP